MLHSYSCFLFHECKEEGGRVLKKSFPCKNWKQVLFGESSNDLAHPGEADMVIWSCTLQMKGRWESNINVRFLIMYSQKWNCAGSLFPKQNYIWFSVCRFLHSYICERFIYFQDRSVYSAAGKYVDRSWEIAHRHMNVEIATEAL